MATNDVGLLNSTTGYGFLQEWTQDLGPIGGTGGLFKLSVSDLGVKFPLGSELFSFKISALGDPSGSQPKLFCNGDWIEIYPKLLPASFRCGRKRATKVGEEDMLEKAFSELPGIKEHEAALKKWANRIKWARAKHSNIARPKHAPEHPLDQRSLTP